MFSLLAGLLRRYHSWRRRQKELKLWSEWSEKIKVLPSSNSQPKAAIIRLDDIGDYILWQQFLPYYKKHCLAKGLKPLLIGNQAWKPLHDALYPDIDALWVNKGRYFSEEKYRALLWNQIAENGFKLAIAPARTRPLLLDDIIALATNATQKSAAKSTSNQVLDTEIFTELFAAKPAHELEFNRAVCEAITALKIDESALTLKLRKVKANQNTILFIGASAGSKRWPADNWAKLSEFLGMEGHKLILGGGPGDKQLESDILALNPSVQSSVGKLTLLESLQQISGAKLVISGDTMAAHAAVAGKVPLILIANGTNASRFSDYNLENVRILYPKRYLESKKKEGYEASSADLATVTVDAVMELVEDMKVV